MEVPILLGINAYWGTKGAVPELLKEALQEAKQEARFYKRSITTQVIHLKDELQELYDPQNVPERIVRLLEKLRTAAAWIIASPIVWGTKPDVLHTLTCYFNEMEYPVFPLRGKPFGIIVHGKEDGGRETLMNIAGPLLVDLDMCTPPGTLFYKIKNGAELSEGGWMLTNHRMVGQNLVRHILINQYPCIDPNKWSLR